MPLSRPVPDATSVSLFLTYLDYKLDEMTGLCSYNPNTTESCCLQSEGKQCKQCNRGMSLVGGSCVQTESLGCLEKTVSGECVNCSSG